MSMRVCLELVGWGFIYIIIKVFQVYVAFVTVNASMIDAIARNSPFSESFSSAAQVLNPYFTCGERGQWFWGEFLEFCRHTNIKSIFSPPIYL